jgi:hypothetical protein
MSRGWGHHFDVWSDVTGRHSARSVNLLCTSMLSKVQVNCIILRIPYIMCRSIFWCTIPPTGYPGDITSGFNSLIFAVETESDIPGVARGGYGTPKNWTAHIICWSLKMIQLTWTFDSINVQSKLTPLALWRPVTSLQTSKWCPHPRDITVITPPSEHRNPPVRTYLW